MALLLRNPKPLSRLEIMIDLSAEEKPSDLFSSAVSEGALEDGIFATRKTAYRRFFKGGKSRDVSFSGNNNTTTNRYKIAVTPSATRSLSYDLNGNLTSLSLTANSSLSCTWDARNRLAQIQRSTANGLHLTAFEYDGLGRRTRITEKLNGSVTSDKYFVFDGLAMVEERDGNGNIVKQFFDQGVKILTGPNAGTYFYVRDHEGNIRAIINSSGVVVARYDYDSFGRMTLVSGIDIADFGFQGMYVLRVAGMQYPINLTWARIYDPDLGRWWSKDWVESVNQYPGMGNNPVNYTDPLGLYITWAGGASPEWYRNAGEAYRQAYSTDAGRKLLQILENSQYEVQLAPCNIRGLSGTSRVTNRGGTLLFNGSRSTLVHENEHAAETLTLSDDPANLGVIAPGDDPLYNNDRTTEYRAVRAQNIADRQYNANQGRPHMPIKTYGDQYPVPYPYGTR